MSATDLDLIGRRFDLEGHPDDTAGGVDGFCCPARYRGYCCTEVDGHSGPHRAGDGDTIVQAWGPVIPSDDLVPVDHAPDHGTPGNAIDLIRLAIAQADTQRQALADAGDLDTLAAGFIQLKSLASDLSILLRAVEDNVAELMPEKKVEMPALGVVLERRKGADRKAWQSIDLLDELLRHAAFDTETGEVIDDEAILRQRIHEVLVDCVPFTGSLGWRVTALRDRGIDPDEWCEVTPGRTTVQVHGGREQ